MPYPFERLRQCLAGVVPNPALTPINLSIGEPRHPTPTLVLDALAAGARGLPNYPTTVGAPELREAIADWLVRRHGLGSLSKRSNAPGLRSGYAAGDANLLKAFPRYRTYHGSAMSPAVAAASVAAWSDEALYLGARTPIDDGDFARRLVAEQAVSMLAL